MSIAEENLNFRSTLDDSQFQAAIGRMEVNIGSMTDHITDQNGELETLVKKATDFANNMFSIENMTAFIKSVAQVRSEYEQLELSFSTILKSRIKANALMNDLTSYTVETPFGLTESADAAKQLLSYGFAAKDVVGELKMLGEVATGISVPIADLASEYGNLKKQGSLSEMDISPIVSRGIPVYSALATVLGVAKSEVAGLVSTGKVGFYEIQQAFSNMTSAGGVFGGVMEAQSNSWAGQIERFKDAWSAMLNDIGEGQEGIFSGTISAATTLVENYQRVLDILGLLIYSYGTYRVALMAYGVAQWYATASVVTHGLAVRQLGVIETLVAGGKRLLTSLQLSLNAALAASPIGATIALVAALGVVIYALVQYTDAAEASQERFNNIQEEGGLAAKKEENVINSLINVIKSHTATNEEREAAYKKLQERTKGVLSDFSKEDIAVGKATKSIKDYTEGLRNAAIQKKAYTEFVSLNDQLADVDIKGAKAISLMDKAALRAKALVVFGKYSLKTFGNPAKDPYKGLSDIEKRDYQEATAIVNVKEADEALVKQTKRKIQAQLDTLVARNGSQINNELTKGSGEDNGKKITSIDVIDEKLRELRAAQTKNSDKNKLYSSYAKQIKKLEKDRRRITGELSPSEESEINDRKKFFDELAKLQEEANKKGLSNDQAEVKAIQDKYTKMRDIVKEKGYGKGALTIIDNLEEQETGDLNYRKGTEKLNVELENQKKLYESYENYKAVVGKSAADERFKNEMDLSTSYLEELKYREQEILLEAGDTISGPEKDRLNSVRDKIKIETDAEQEKYDNLIKKLVSYEEERKALVEKYNAEFSMIGGEDKAKNQAILTKKFQENLKTLDETHIKEFESYKKLYEGIDKLSSKNALTVIANAKTMLVQQILTGKISNELANEIGTLIGKAEKSVSEKLPGNITNLSGQITQLSSAVGGVDAAFGKVLGTLGNVVGQVGNIKKGMDDFKTASSEGDTLGQLGAGLGIVGAGISIFQSVFSLFDRSKQREEQAAYSRDLQIKQTEAVTKALDRQLQMINEVYGTEKLTKYAEGLATIKVKQDELTNQLSGKLELTEDKTLNKYIEKFNNGEKLGFGYDVIFKKLQMSGKLVTVPKGLEELRDLLEAGKLDQKTAAIAQALINLDKQAKDTFNALNAEKVGSSLDSIADGFINALTDGTQDFGKSFEDVIQKSIINGFKGEIIRKQLQAFYAQFAELADGGLTKDEIEKLRLSYLAAGEKSKKELEDLEKITGIDFKKDKSDSALKPSGLTASLTQDTGEKLEGLWRGQFDLTKQTNITAMQHLLIAKSNFDTGLKIESNTFRTANNTENLIRLVNIENTLISIDTKTSSKTTRD